MSRYCRYLFFSVSACVILSMNATVFAASLPKPVAHQAPTVNQFNLRFMKLLRHWGVVGGTVAVMKNGRVIASHGYGWSSLNPRVIMQPTTTFRIASVSKTFTAVATLKLVQENRLHLNDRVFDILSDFRPLRGGQINPRLYEITVRDLLNMSSGWYTAGPGRLDPMFGPWSRYIVAELQGNTPPTCVAATRLMMGRPLEFRPGTQFSYSNLNYCMLGLIISKVTQHNYAPASYASFVQNKILIPAGMSNTRLGSTAFYNHSFYETRYFNADPRAANVDGLPYGRSNIIEKNYADGGWVSSATDLARFLQSLASHKILTPYTLHTMLSRPTFVARPDHYFAMGWTIKRINGHWFWSKHGSFTGTAALVMQKDDGTSYVALFNTEPAGKVRFFAEVQRLLTTYPMR